MPDLLSRGSQAFGAGDFATAAQTFNYIRDNYNDEPEWVSGRLPETLLPLAGFASLKTGQYPEAISALEAFFGTESDGSQSNDFARYSLALAYEKAGDTEQALHAFRDLANVATSQSVKGIALLAQARLVPSEEAIEFLTAALAEQLAERVAIQIRLTLIRLALDNENLDAATEHLFAVDWQAVSMPELATLSFLAFELGDQLIASRPEDALRAFRLVSPKPTLIEEQEKRLRQLEARFRNRARDLPAQQAIWVDFYRDLIKSLKTQLRILHETDDYQSTLDYRKALCFQSLRRPLEAWLLLESLSLSEHPDLAPLAHRQWIGVARDIQAWKASAVIAQEYLNRYPDRDDALDALYWIGQAQMEIRAYRDAGATFRALASRTPDATLKATSLYFQAFCLTALEEHRNAIPVFEASRQAASDKPIAAQSALWAGICHFLLDDFEQARLRFDEIESIPEWSFIHGEAAFRKAYCLYGEFEYAQAKELLSDWVVAYPMHARASEAYLLLGDLHRDDGELDDALASYAQVATEHRELRFYAVVNASEVLREKNQPSQAVDLLYEFERDPIPLRHVGVFYKTLAATLIDATRSEQATQALMRGITRFGNDAKAEGIIDLLELVELSTIELADQKDQARQSNQPFFASRCQLTLVHRHQQDSQTAKADLELFKLASDYDRENLPPECLVALGNRLIEIGSVEGSSYLEHCLETYPDSSYVSQAYFGLSKHARKRGKIELALEHLANAETASPTLSANADILAFKGDLLFEARHFDQAMECFQALLADRQLDHSRKADALFKLGQCYLAQEDPEAAYASFQRVFTLYRGSQSLVAESYLQCIEILELRNSPHDALAVCLEFLDQDDLVPEPAYRKAESLREKLLATTSIAPKNDASTQND